MVRLNEEIEETVHLGRLEGADIHFIAALESPRALRVASRLGRVMPAHCTSSGKVLLAMLPDTDLKRLCPHERLPQLTEKSIATRTELLAVLVAVRRRGHATSREESEEGVSSVAVAVPGNPPPRVALTASVPRSRMTPAHQRDIRERLVAAAERIHALIG